jgi:hypothetical protein
MKWKKTLTAEEITLHVMGMGYPYYFDQNSGLLESRPPPPRYQPKELGSNEMIETKGYKPLEQLMDEILDRKIEAQSIYEALIDEICLVDPYNELIDDRVLKDTHLVIAARAQAYEEVNSLVPHETTVTKESAALWFYHMGDTEKARLLVPNFNPENQIDNELIKLRDDNKALEEENEVLRKELEQTAKPQAKTRINPSDYLKAIGVMAIMCDAESNKNTFRHGGEISASKFKDKAETIGLAGLSNLNKDIAQALKDEEIKALLLRLEKNS